MKQGLNKEFETHFPRQQHCKDITWILQIVNEKSVSKKIKVQKFNFKLMSPFAHSILMTTLTLLTSLYRPNTQL